MYSCDGAAIHQSSGGLVKENKPHCTWFFCGYIVHCKWGSVAYHRLIPVFYYSWQSERFIQFCTADVKLDLINFVLFCCQTMVKSFEVSELPGFFLTLLFTFFFLIRQYSVYHYIKKKMSLRRLKQAHYCLQFSVCICVFVPLCSCNHVNCSSFG
jgi:hypothetical protein